MVAVLQEVPTEAILQEVIMVAVLQEVPTEAILQEVIMVVLTEALPREATTEALPREATVEAIRQVIMAHLQSAVVQVALQADQDRGNHHLVEARALKEDHTLLRPSRLPPKRDRPKRPAPKPARLPSAMDQAALPADLGRDRLLLPNLKEAFCQHQLQFLLPYQPLLLVR